MPDRRKIVVLLVEDHADYAMTVKDMLEMSGRRRFAVEHRPTLASAIAYLRYTDVVDVVLLDLCLDDSSGLDTLRAIHATAPRVPVVVLSGQVNEEVRLEALRAGAAEALQKGEITQKALARVVVTALENERKHAIQRWRDEVERLTTKIHRLREEWGLQP